MRVTQFTFLAPQDLAACAEQIQAHNADLCILFASPEYFEHNAFVTELSQCCNNLIGCSSAGEIHQTEVLNHSAVLTLIQFTTTRALLFSAELEQMQSSFNCGANLATLVNEKLAKHVNQTQALLVFGQGVNINGSGLLDGLQQNLATDVAVSGGLAGDNGKFERTYTCINGQTYTNRVVAVALVGTQLNISHGCYGGWRAFGPLRRITHAEDNVLYTLDQLPALEVYKNYLGEYASQLPASGLLFPFEIFSDEHEATGVLRTILGVDEAKQSLVLAGHVDTGDYLRLMHSSNDSLVDGAEKAAGHAVSSSPATDQLAILVSCVGRKLVMGDSVEEEIEVIADTLGPGYHLTGFYSNGEMNRLAHRKQSELHNQTMTITVIGEY